jgi:PAS domain S-box-containing protein
MQKKALLVDSDYFFVEFLSELLAKRGYEVLKAYDGKQAIAMLEREAADIVFADLVLPKIDGRQLFDFIRKKYNGNPFPLVALSGTMIEHLGSLQELGADFFIAKGPIDKLTAKLNEFMAEIERGSFLPEMDGKVLATGNVFPRRDAVELLNSLLFHKAVIDSAVIGIVVVDADTRIIHANPEALEVIGKNSIEVINVLVSQLFVDDARAEVADGLNLVQQQKDLKNVALNTTLCSRAVTVAISPIHLKDGFVGWVLVLKPALQDEE